MHVSVCVSECVHACVCMRVSCVCMCVHAILPIGRCVVWPFKAIVEVCGLHQTVSVWECVHACM
jgi:hypothetical protein